MVKSVKKLSLFRSQHIYQTRSVCLHTRHQHNTYAWTHLLQTHIRCRKGRCHKAAGQNYFPFLYCVKQFIRQTAKSWLLDWASV